MTCQFWSKLKTRIYRTLGISTVILAEIDPEIGSEPHKPYFSLFNPTQKMANSNTHRRRCIAFNQKLYLQMPHGDFRRGCVLKSDFSASPYFAAFHDIYY